MFRAAAVIFFASSSAVSAAEDCPGKIIDFLWWKDICWWSGPPIDQDNRRQPAQAPIILEVTPRPTPPWLYEACPVLRGGKCIEEDQ